MARESHRGVGAGEGAVLVERHDDLVLLRTPSDSSFTPADIDDLARGLRSAEGVVTVVADARAVAAPAFWPRLSASLDALRAAGTSTVRLVMTGAGDDRPQHPALGWRIADAWGMTVEAPDGAAFLVPGGSLFVPFTEGRPGDWRRFSPNRAPVRLGPRCPAPPWQGALGRARSRTAGGCVVEQIPAGVIVRPAQAPASGSSDLYQAVPLDPRRPTVVVGVPRGEDVSASDLAELLAEIPELVDFGVRLAPGGQRDVLPMAQGVADALGAEVEVSTGLPLLAAGEPLGAYAGRSVLVGLDGTPAWLPFVDAVVCRPSRDGEDAAEPRLLRWAPPVPAPGKRDDGVVQLSDRWQLTATRAGLWIGARDAVRGPGTERAAAAEGPALEIGVPGEVLADSLWPVLDRLLDALGPALCVRATAHVHGTPADAGRELRALVAKYGLASIRYTTAEQGAVPGSAVVVPAHAPTRKDDPSELVARRSAPPAPVPEPAAPARPHRSAETAAEPDLVAAWEHLSLGRETTLEAGFPAPPPAAPDDPDLDLAWQVLSRDRESTTPAAPPLVEVVPPAEAAVSHAPSTRPLRPLRPGHRSSEAERGALLALAAPVRERHAAAVAEALTRLPGLASIERESAEGDLMALRLYLDGEDGPLGHRQLTRALRMGDDRLLAQAACLASGLRRLPAYRGVVVRGAGAAPEDDEEGLPVGGLLRDGAPLSSVPLVVGRDLPRGPRYAIWSVTGRRVEQVFGDEQEEVVFAPGTPFRILDVRRAGVSPVVLLRELPASGAVSAVLPRAEVPVELDDADRAAFARLDEALKGRSARSGSGGWPQRCAGPIGDGP